MKGFERHDNPYAFNGHNSKLSNKLVLQTRLISLIALAAISPLALTWLQRNWPIVPNIAYVMTLLAVIVLAAFIPNGRARFWMPILCTIVFVKFVVLSAFLDLIFNGFDGIH